VTSISPPSSLPITSRSPFATTVGVQDLGFLRFSLAFVSVFSLFFGSLVLSCPCGLLNVVVVLFFFCTYIIILLFIREFAAVFEVTYMCVVSWKPFLMVFFFSSSSFSLLLVVLLLSSSSYSSLVSGVLPAIC
jgi:hypothetical protein